MNATEALNKIADLLGMRFKSEKFMVTKLMDNQTTITNNDETPFSVGQQLFIVGEDSILKPAPAGVHKTREGLVIETSEDSTIVKIEDVKTEEERSTVTEAETDVEVETEVNEFTTAKLADGTEIMTEEEGDKFEVGQKLYAKTESGEVVTAPEGEHTTESGIVLTVDSEGFITGVKYPDSEGEGSLQEDMKKMKQAMERMLGMMTQFSSDFQDHKKDYEAFKKQPQTSPVVKKTFAKENILDAKVEFLKNALRK
jgi:ribosomal protein L21E